MGTIRAIRDHLGLRGTISGLLGTIEAWFALLTQAPVGGLIPGGSPSPKVGIIDTFSAQKQVSSIHLER